MNRGEGLYQQVEQPEEDRSKTKDQESGEEPLKQTILEIELFIGWVFEGFVPDGNGDGTKPTKSSKDQKDPKDDRVHEEHTTSF